MDDPDDPAHDWFADLSFAAGYRQLTDIYLLGLAVKRRGHLATFDRTKPWNAVRGATAHTLAIIRPPV